MGFDWARIVRCYTLSKFTQTKELFKLLIFLSITPVAPHRFTSSHGACVEMLSKSVYLLNPVMFASTILRLAFSEDLETVKYTIWLWASKVDT